MPLKSFPILLQYLLLRIISTLSAIITITNHLILGRLLVHLLRLVYSCAFFFTSNILAIEIDYVREVIVYSTPSIYLQISRVLFLPLV